MDNRKDFLKRLFWTAVVMIGFFYILPALMGAF